MSDRGYFRFFGLVVIALACWCGGCTALPAGLNDEVNRGPTYSPRNYFALPKMPPGVARVVLLPVAAGNLTTEEVTAALDAALAASAIRAERFEVVTLGRTDCRALLGRSEFSLAEALPPTFLADLKQRTFADAVLMVELTNLKLYQPQSLGFRARLASCLDGGVFWSFDEVLSAGDATVRNSARREYFQQEHGNRPYDFSLAGLQSPSWFAGFVARQMFSTLPPR